MHFHIYMYIHPHKYIYIYVYLCFHFHAFLQIWPFIIITVMINSFRGFFFTAALSDSLSLESKRR